MAGITVGTGCTFTGASIEKQLWQEIHYIQNAERISTEEERFTSTKDDTFLMKGRFTIPGALNYNPSTGLFYPIAIPYLPNTVFSAGSPLGTIKGTFLSQYFVDTVQYIVHWQNNPVKNPASNYNLSMTFDYSTLTFTGEFSLPYTVGLGVEGSITETATDWLTT
jgi:hypothetical protein